MCILFLLSTTAEWQTAAAARDIATSNGSETTSVSIVTDSGGSHGGGGGEGNPFNMTDDTIRDNQGIMSWTFAFRNGM